MSDYDYKGCHWSTGGYQQYGPGSASNDELWSAAEEMRQQEEQEAMEAEWAEEYAAAEYDEPQAAAPAAGSNWQAALVLAAIAAVIVQANGIPWFLGAAGGLLVGLFIPQRT